MSGGPLSGFFQGKTHKAGYIGTDEPKYRFQPMNASKELQEKYPGH